MRLTIWGSLVTADALASETYSLPRETVRNFAEFILGKYIQQSQGFITSVVCNMLCVRRNPHRITDRNVVYVTIDHDLSATAKYVVHLCWCMRVSTWWSHCTYGNFGNSHHEFLCR